MITFWHHKSCRVMTKDDREGRSFHPILTQMMYPFSCKISCHVAFQRIQKILAYNGEQEKGSIIRVRKGWEKIVPRDNRLSSLGKPRDANRRSSGRIFLSHLHTHDGFLYYILNGRLHAGRDRLACTFVVCVQESQVFARRVRNDNCFYVVFHKGFLQMSCNI